MSIGERLKEERKRLGFAQPAFAEMVNASKSSLIRWEAGEQMPDAAALAIWSGIGLDVLYVVTGKGNTAAALTPRERALLDNYRHSDEHGKGVIDSTTSAVAQPAKKAANSRSK